MMLLVLALVAICSVVLGVFLGALLAGPGRADAEEETRRAERERDEALASVPFSEVA